MKCEYAVTVVVTTYNLEKYIGQCLDELYKQSFIDFEILVIDDCSKDRTVDIVEEYKNIFRDRLKTIYLKKNMGMPAITRNIALESGMISGGYVLFLDGDDDIETEMIAKMYHRAIYDQADIVICGYDRVEKFTNKIISKEMINRNDAIIMPNGKNYIPYINTAPWNKLWRREIIEDIRFPSFKVGEEVSFNYKAYIKSNRISFIDEVLIHYNIREESIISNTDEETVWEFAREMKKMVNDSPNEFREICEELCFFHIGLSMPLRAISNNDINIDIFIKKIEEYFEGLNWFKGNKYLKLRNLSRKGVKGVMIWMALTSYKIKVFKYLLKIYRFLGLEIKF